MRRASLVGRAVLVHAAAIPAAIPAARFQLLPGTGHLPQIETPGQLMRAVLAFAEAPAAR